MNLFGIYQEVDGFNNVSVILAGGVFACSVSIGINAASTCESKTNLEGLGVGASLGFLQDATPVVRLQSLTPH